MNLVSKGKGHQCINPEPEGRSEGVKSEVQYKGRVTEEVSSLLRK